MQEQNAVAIITARGGSKRIPGKNKKEFCGKPIICYSIEAALASGIFDEVMVSTEDEEIAALAGQAGAEVPFLRSESAADDFATTDDVLLEVLAEYEKRGRTFRYMACLYPTAPFVTAQKLKSAFDTLRESGASGVMPVVPFSFPPQRGMRVENGRLVYCYPENAAKRSQDLDTVYHDCGQFYFYDVEKYRRTGGDLKDGYVAVILPETEAQDIDNTSDWELAELKYRMMKAQDPNGRRPGC